MTAIAPSEPAAAALARAEQDLRAASAAVQAAALSAADFACAAAQIAAVRAVCARLLPALTAVRDHWRGVGLAEPTTPWSQRAEAVDIAAQAVRNALAGLRELPLGAAGAEIVWNLQAQTQMRFGVARFQAKWARLSLYELGLALQRAAPVLQEAGEALGDPAYAQISGGLSGLPGEVALLASLDDPQHLTAALDALDLLSVACEVALAASARR